MKIEKTVDRESKISLYVQVYSIFKDKITSGEWPVGTQIPAEDDLCETYNVSKSTVREAIYELVREGYLKRQQGKGTFVTPSAPHLGLVMRTRLTENVDGEARTVKREIMERGEKETPMDIKRFLSTENHIYYVLCKNMANDEAFIDELFIPLFLIPDIEREAVPCNSFYDLIEEKGTKKIFKVLQIMEVMNMKGSIAAILNQEEGTLALVLSRLFTSSDGSRIGYSRFISGGSKFKLQMEFERLK